MSAIQWLSSIDEALNQAKQANKLVLIDFASPTWGGCKRLEAVVYPEATVASFIQQNFIPVKVIAPDNPDLSARYVATWTPTLIVLDAEGREHYRTVGYLPAQDYIARMQLARAKTAYDLGNYAQAIQLCQEVAQQYTGTEAAPEALYWLGVAQYKSTGDVAPLKEAWKAIRDKYPQSEWAKKVSFVFE